MSELPAYPAALCWCCCMHGAAGEPVSKRVGAVVPLPPPSLPWCQHHALRRLPAHPAAALLQTRNCTARAWSGGLRWRKTLLTCSSTGAWRCRWRRQMAWATLMPGRRWAVGGVESLGLCSSTGVWMCRWRHLMEWANTHPPRPSLPASLGICMSLRCPTPLPSCATTTTTTLHTLVCRRAVGLRGWAAGPCFRHSGVPWDLERAGDSSHVHAVLHHPSQPTLALPLRYYSLHLLQPAAA